MNLNEMAKEINAANVAKGFYEEPETLIKIVEAEAPGLVPAMQRLFFAQRIALITSEASEALESNRKEKVFDNKWQGLDWDAMDESDFKEAFERHVKDTQEDETADVLIRLLDLAGYMKIDLDFHVAAKLKYNSLRPYKHGKKY